MEESTCLLFDLRGSQCSNGVFTCPHGCAPRDYGIPMTVPLPDPCGPLTGPNMCAVATKYAWDRDLDVFVRNLLIEITDFGPRAVCGPFTEICPLGSGCKEPLLFGEIFSGGFSGWSRGTSFLSTLGLPGRTCFSLDWDARVCAVHERVHLSLHVHGQSPPSWSDLHKNISCVACVSESPAFIWMRLQGISIWLCSPPCPPFTSAHIRGAKGWSHRDAWPFEFLFGQMRVSLDCMHRECAWPLFRIQIF